MDGMTTLATEGLDLSGLESSTQVEQLVWHNPAAGDMPDAEATVLMWVLLEDGDELWEGGWWDGEAWRLAESGGICPGTVSAWSEPNGPAARPACSPTLTPLERLQNDLAVTEFASDTAQRRLAGLVAQLQGERSVMAGLMRELLAVVETVEPEDTEESLHLWTLKDKASTLLLALDAG